MKWLWTVLQRTDKIQLRPMQKRSTGWRDIINAHEHLAKSIQPTFNATSWVLLTPQTKELSFLFPWASAAQGGSNSLGRYNILYNKFPCAFMSSLWNFINLFLLGMWSPWSAPGHFQCRKLLSMFFPQNLIEFRSTSCSVNWYFCQTFHHIYHHMYFVSATLPQYNCNRCCFFCWKLRVSFLFQTVVLLDMNCELSWLYSRSQYSSCIQPSPASLVALCTALQVLISIKVQKKWSCKWLIVLLSNFDDTQ